MRRREVITVLGGAAAWPLAALVLRPPAAAQARARRIAVLGPAEEPRFSQVAAGLERGLHEQGFSTESLEIVKTMVERGDHEAARSAVTGFLPSGIEVAFVIGSELARVARQVSSELPLLFITPGDPVAAGLVASLSRPGGNTTAVTFEYPELSSKRLEIIRAVLPTADLVLVFYDPRDGSSRLAMAEARDAAPKLGLSLVEREVSSRDDAIRGLEALGGVHAFLAIPGGAPATAYADVIQAATGRRVATVFHGRTESTQGALASYGASDVDVARDAARLVARILRGEKAGDLPVERPTRLDLTINLKTAKALGLDIPPTLLARADEVIE
jgi:putative tryptophan/tyrosine transport system substrate-binding protein